MSNIARVQEYVSGLKIKWPTIMGAEFSISNTYTQNMKFHDFETIVFNTTLKMSQNKPFKMIPKQRKYFSLEDQIPQWKIIIFLFLFLFIFQKYFL